MATIKFSAFSPGGTGDGATTQLVGFKVGDATANYKYSISDVATMISPSISTIYTGDGTIGAARVATITDTPKFQGTQSTNIGLEIDNQYNLSMDPASGGSKLLLSSGTSGVTTLELRANRTGNGGSNSSQTSITSSGSLTLEAGDTAGWNHKFATGTQAHLRYEGSNAGSVLRINSNGGGTPNRFDIGWNSIHSAYIGSTNGVLALGHNIGGVLTECLNYNIAGDLTLDSGTGVMSFKDDGVTLATIASLRQESFVIACSDETTALAAGTNKAIFRMPYAFTLTAVRASLTTAGTTSGLTTIDIHESGTTILSTKITIDLTETTSVTAATQPVISDASLADDAQISIDLDAISGGASETGLKVTLIGYQTV